MLPKKIKNMILTKDYIQANAIVEAVTVIVAQVEVQPQNVVNKQKSV